MHATFTDRITVGSTRRTADGYLVADAKVARTGVQEYLGSELGRPDMPSCASTARRRRSSPIPPCAASPTGR